MRHLSILLVWLATATLGYSQTKIKGFLKGLEKGNALPLVELLKWSKGDTSLARSAFADSSGAYSLILVAPGTYRVRFSGINLKQNYPGYVNVRSGMALLTLDTVDLTGKSIGVLETATITSKRAPMFEQDREKLVFNVETSPINAGSNALEALQKIPGVYVDANGNILINGQPGAQIRLNGRLLNMGQTEKTEILRNLDVALVKKIELSTLPNSSNDASGSAGVINIVLKKNINLGLNGNISLTRRQSGSFSRNNTGLALSYLKNKWNVFANLSYSKRTSFDSLDIRRDIKKTDTFIIQKTYSQYPYQTLALTSGAVYSLTAKSDLSFSFNHNNTKGETNGTSNTWINKITAPSLPANTATAGNHYDYRLRFTSANLNYTLRPDSSGSEFYMNIDRAGYEQNNSLRSQINEQQNGSPNSFIRTGNITSNIKLRSFDAQYFHRHIKSWVLKGGVKYARSITTNNAAYHIEKNGQVFTEGDKTVSFKYSESIYAGFAEIEKSLKRQTFIAGVRLENTLFEGNTILPKDTSIGYKRTDLFPFFYISQKTFGNQTVTLTYSRRIDRPGFNDLNPFLVYYDPYTYTKGNPKLKPQFTNKIEAAYNLTRLPVLKIGYSLTRDALTNITYQDDSAKITYRTIDNLAKKEAWNISTTVPIGKKRLLMVNYFSFGINIFDGYYENLPIHVKKNSFTCFNNTTYTFKNGLMLEAGGFYNRGILYGLFELGEVWAVNFGAQKQFFKKKLSIKCNVTDIFRSQVNAYSFKQYNVDLGAKQYTDSRSVTLSMVYRFGIRSKSTSARQSSIEAEKRRVQQAEH